MSFSEDSLDDSNRLRWFLKAIEFDLWLPKNHSLLARPSPEAPKPKSEAPKALSVPARSLADKLPQSASSLPDKATQTGAPKLKPKALSVPAAPLADKATSSASSASPLFDKATQEPSVTSPPPSTGQSSEAPEIRMFLLPLGTWLWVFSQAERSDTLTEFIRAVSSFVHRDEGLLQKPKPFHWPQPEFTGDQSESVALEALRSVTGRLAFSESRLVVIGLEAAHWLKRASIRVTDETCFESAEKLMGTSECKRRLWHEITALPKDRPLE